MHRLLNILLLLTAIFAGVAPANAGKKLITSASQFHTNASSKDSKYSSLNTLLLNDPSKAFITDTTKTDEHHYLTVTLNDDFTMTEGDNLVVVLTRPDRSAVDSNVPTTINPTAMEVHYSLDGKEWVDSVLCRVYFIYRGSGTTELSEHLPLEKINERIAKCSGADKSIKDVKMLKFIVTMNNGKKIIGNGIRPMMLSGFQIYKVKKGERVVGRWIDRFHLDTDVNYRYYDYDFRHTQGALDPANRYGGGSNGEGTLESLGGWGNFVNENGKTVWKADKAYLEKYDIQMPDFTPLNSTNDANITNTELNLQRTATIEHVVYAVQGEPIALHPFYTMAEPDKGNYQENFIHWYDYRTGRQLTNEAGEDLLDFLVDPSEVFRSKEHGWYTSSLFDTDEKIVEPDSGIGDVDYFTISNVDDYIAFVDSVNAGNTTASARLETDLYFKDYIAAGNKVSPIGTDKNPWKGSFIGNGYTIHDLVIESTKTIAVSSMAGTGMFGTVTSGAYISNLTLDSGCSIKGVKNVGFVGLHHQGSLTLTGITSHAKIIGPNNAAALIGVLNTPNFSGTIEISNCLVTSPVNPANENKNDENALLIGWIRTGNGIVNLNITNTVITSTSTGFTKGYELYRNNGLGGYIVNVSNCYSIGGLQGTSAIDATTDINSDAFLTQSKLTGWTVGSSMPVPPIAKRQNFIIPSKKAHRKYGTYATFMYPRDPFAESGNLRDIGKKEYIVAADMAQQFNTSHNISGNTIIEPTIQFRHIFRIKDGKEFADSNMATYDGNRAFIMKNMRHITATAKTDFQVRLDFPYPVERTTRGVFYYKIDDTDYRRVCSRYFRVYKDGELIQTRDEKTHQILVNGKPSDSPIFYATGVFNGQGDRQVDVDGVVRDYYLCGGGGSFYRMMACDAKHAEPGRYTVQVVGTDYDGETILLADGSGQPLLIQEFQITFLDEKNSLFVTEKELNEHYSSLSNTELTRRYGEPADKIDFDEYRYLMASDKVNTSLYLTTISNDGQTGHYLRWPMPWEQSNYGFGYNQRGDFAMQMIVDNQAITPYHSLGVNKEVNNYGKGVGLFDRLFYEEKGEKRGFFYYVNAADDPGIIARLELNTFCTGSTIHISCWIAEFSSSPESANLSFNFVARLKNGERVPLHSHITGYVGQENTAEYNRRGQWLYVYSSFVPILTDKGLVPSDVDHYEVELDNNAKSSYGADYAIDDIRVYIARPIIYADQTDLVCMTSKSVDIKLSSDFESMLQSLDVNETTDPARKEAINLYYTILDREKFYNTLNTPGKTYQEAFDDAVLRYDYDNNGTVSYYGSMKFYNCFDAHDEYGSNTSDHDPAYVYRDNDGEHRMLVFNTRPQDNMLFPGKEYIIVVLSRAESADDDDDMPALFANGQPDADDFDVDGDCTKQCTFTVRSSHIIKVDGEVRTQSNVVDACHNQSPVIQVNLYAQTPDGETVMVEENATFDWFNGSMSEFASITDSKGLSLWKAINEFRVEYPDAVNLNDNPRGDYTPEMKALLVKYATFNTETRERERLFIGDKSYQFDPLVLPEGKTEGDAYVLAVPIPKYVGEDLLVCTEPTEVHVIVRNRAPRMTQGFKEIDYPNDINNVPLRISLKQLKAARSEATPLRLPLRIITPVTDGVSHMKKPVEGAQVELTGTNDPEYGDLGVGANSTSLKAMGEVLTVEADKEDIDNSEVSLIFYTEMHFKEGYEYTMRFLFTEQVPELSEDIDPCDGHMVFTLKVVPEYQIWTGAAGNLNWNNDANWRRVSRDDIDAASGSLAEHVTDGTNSQPFSYAPLDFTKVVIPKGESVPELFHATTSTVTRGIKSYTWNGTPSEYTKSGDATFDVQYDMMQLIADDGTRCIPWQAHYCNEIHFEPAAEIGHQQHLHYNRAWVDMEVDPTRWYTLSSPLQGVVAGDMYLPSDNARQATPYFEEITFKPGQYNRFKPAVFQRSWNQASAIVINSDDAPQKTSYAMVENTWSNVFNDVTEQYAPGHGFSIKTDLADINLGESDKVKFRLPKADTAYYYFSDQGASGDNTPISRTNPYRLNDANGVIELTAATTNNEMFLVGNPFMAHMDIKKFLEVNNEVVAPAYWILEGNRQGATVMDDAYEFNGTLDTPRFIAPMQGFFVKALTPGKKLKLKYTSDMAITINDEPSLADVLTRSSAGGYDGLGLRIRAKESGSAALLLVNDAATADYNELEDAIFVSDPTLEAPALVYTVAESTATTVNALPEIRRTEVGVTAADGQRVTLVFEGVNTHDNLMLYDALTDTYTEIFDGMETVITGSAVQRLYVVSSIEQIDEELPAIDIIVMDNGVRISSTEGNLSARIYDLSGRMLESRTDCGNDTLIPLEKGIYIVDATDCVGKSTRKIMIR